VLALLGVRVTVLDQTTTPALRIEGELPGGGDLFAVTTVIRSTASIRAPLRPVTHTVGPEHEGLKAASSTSCAGAPSSGYMAKAWRWPSWSGMLASRFPTLPAVRQTGPTRRRRPGRDPAGNWLRHRR
jgi:hypothetical protein